MLELVGVVVEAGGVTCLDRCSFECRAGEVLGLAGGTGAGKSTALAVAGGLRATDRGRVLLAGRDVTKSPQKLRDGVALAGPAPGPRDVGVNAWLRFWAELDGVPAKARSERIGAAAETFGLPLTDRAVGVLSSGELTRLTLVRAWVRHAQLTLLDAPDASLDGDGLRRLTGAVRSASADGRSFIIAGATPHLLTMVCERVALLKSGAVRATAARGEDGFARNVAAAAGWGE